MNAHRNLSRRGRIVVLAALVGALTIGGAVSFAGGEHGHDEHGHDEHGHGAEEGEHTDEVMLSPAAQQLYGVTLATAERRRLTDLVAVPARVVLNPERTAHVGVAVEGRVVELTARVGDRVAAGDALAVLDSPAIGEAESEFLQRQAEAATARTTVEVARKAFERAEQLGSGSGITVTEFQKREGELQLAQGALVAAEAMGQAARNKLQLLGVARERIDALQATGEISTRYTVRAPIDGEVIEREVTLGEIVGPDRESLLVVADLSAPWIMADMPERDLARIAPGAAATVVFGALPGLTFEGRVAHVAAVLDARSRKGTVRIELAAMPGGDPSPSPSGSNDDHGHDDHAHDDHDDHGHDVGASTVEYTPAQIADYKSRGDWCGEHDVPESACVLCNPSLAEAVVNLPAPSATPSTVAYTPAQIADYKSRGDWCGEHDVPESACVLCNPSLAEAIEAANDATTLGPPAAAAAVVLRAGMLGEAELTLAPAAGRASLAFVVVPLSAVLTVEGGPAVFVPVAGEPNTFAKRAVTVGPRSGRWVPVISGLRAGESYVATGSFILKAELGKEGAAHEH